MSFLAPIAVLIYIASLSRLAGQDLRSATVHVLRNEKSKCLPDLLLLLCGDFELIIFDIDMISQLLNRL